MLDDTTNDFTGVVDVMAFVDVVLNDVNDIVLGDISTPVTQSVRVSVGGSITDTVGRSIQTGLATLNAAMGAVILDSDHDLDAVVATAATDLTVNDVDDLSLDGLSAGGTISVTAANLSVTEDVTSTGGAVDLATSAGNVAIDGGTEIQAEGLLTITPVGGALTDGAAGNPIPVSYTHLTLPTKA